MKNDPPAPQTAENPRKPIEYSDNDAKPSKKIEDSDDSDDVPIFRHMVKQRNQVEVSDNDAPVSQASQADERLMTTCPVSGI